ncbi:MAG: YicC family protein, partial [Bacteroidales bacterium]|nr:YicC family protein [Bacteroidales bacterium]
LLMIKSMTGFGKSQASYKNKNITIEIKSLNSKQIDFGIRIPSKYRSLDIVIRNQISSNLERGKIECIIYEENIKSNLAVNKENFISYYRELEELADSVKANKDDLFRLALQNSENNSTIESLEEEEEDFIIMLLFQCLNNINSFRETEGLAIEKDLRLRISNISKGLKLVDNFEYKRIDIIKEKIKQRLEDINLGNYDENRLEQELIYWLEKIDITEEKIRLAQHLEYFIQTLELPKSQGKKLGFIAQEIGREINTLGSKANDINLQKIVVDMKDELEKIKEQVLNVL